MGADEDRDINTDGDEHVMSVWPEEPMQMPKIDSGELLRVNIVAVASSSGQVNYFTGHLIRGALLNLISRNNEGLVSELHDGRGRRPYSVAPVRLPYRADQRDLLWVVQPGQRIVFRVCGLRQEVNSSILNGILANRSGGIRLGETPMEIVEVNFESSTYFSLATSKVNTREFEFKFLSPTKFEIRSETFPMLFPLPMYLFGSLGSLWNEFAPPELTIDMDTLMNDVRTSVCVTQHALRTVSIKIKGHIPHIGFVGRARFKVAREAPRRVIDEIALLSAFARYAGVGAKRAFGLGAVDTRPVRRDNDDRTEIDEDTGDATEV